MGVLKIKKEGTPEAESEPRAADNADQVFREFDMARVEKTVTRYRSGIGPVLATTAFCVLIVAGLGYWVATTGLPNAGQKPFVYFELKAIDQGGRAVAGADVSFNRQQVGVTDSFGEWRRFMRVPLGSTVTLSLVKKIGARRFSAMKNLVVPLREPDKGEIELGGRIQMAPVIEAPPVVDVASSSPVGVPSDATLDVVSNEAPLASTLSEPEADESIKKTGPQAFHSIWFSVANWQNDAKQQAYLTQKLIPALRQRSIQLGLSVEAESAWQVSVQHVDPGAGKANLMRIVANIPGQRRKIDFLRKPKDTVVLTARSLLAALRAHTPYPYSVHRQNKQWQVATSDSIIPYWSVGGQDRLVSENGGQFVVKPFKNGFVLSEQAKRSPCQLGAKSFSRCVVERVSIPSFSPGKGWVRRAMVVKGMGSDDTLFVAGYKALKSEEGTWEAWVPGVEANVTVVNSRSVVYRRHIRFHSNRPTLMTLPSRPIVRR